MVHSVPQTDRSQPTPRSDMLRFRSENEDNRLTPVEKYEGLVDDNVPIEFDRLIGSFCRSEM